MFTDTDVCLFTVSSIFHSQMAVEMQAETGGAPKGNWVARNLRLQNDSSGQLFPRTPPDVRAAKYQTLYTQDYHDFPTEAFLAGLAAKVYSTLL